MDINSIIPVDSIIDSIIPNNLKGLLPNVSGSKDKAEGKAGKVEGKAGKKEMDLEGLMEETAAKSMAENAAGAQKGMMEQAGATVQGLQQATIQPTKVDASATPKKKEDTASCPAPSPGASATSGSHLTDLLTRGGQGTPA